MVYPHLLQLQVYNQIMMMDAIDGGHAPKWIMETNSHSASWKVSGPVGHSVWLSMKKEYSTRHAMSVKKLKGWGGDAKRGRRTFYAECIIHMDTSRQCVQQRGCIMQQSTIDNIHSKTEY
jgi:hypothetical protein